MMLFAFGTAELIEIGMLLSVLRNSGISRLDQRQQLFQWDFDNYELASLIRLFPLPRFARPIRKSFTVP
jgi:hypothetical protein